MTSALAPARSLGDPSLLLTAASSGGQDCQDLRRLRPGRANHHDLVARPNLPGGKPGSAKPPGRDVSLGPTWASPPGSAA
jgi:hypothetical protein